MAVLSLAAHPFNRWMVIVLAVGFMALEYGIARLARRDTHDLRESASSLGVAAGQSLIRILEAGAIAIPFAYVHAQRLFDFDTRGALAIATLSVATEFVYYWHHRASHRIRWLWATHFACTTHRTRAASTATTAACCRSSITCSARMPRRPPTSRCAMAWPGARPS